MEGHLVFMPSHFDLPSLANPDKKKQFHNYFGAVALTIISKSWSWRNWPVWVELTARFMQYPPDGTVPVLQGKRGTLKRRREIKAILEHDSNNNGQDDLFQATPFRMKRTAKVGAEMPDMRSPSFMTIFRV